MHLLALVLFGFLEVESHDEDTDGPNDANPETDAPRSTKVVFCSSEDDYHRNDGCNDETHVNGEISREDEPPMTMALLELAGGLSRSSRASRIYVLLSAHPNVTECPTNQES